MFSGHYIPELSQIIVQRNKGMKNPAINFKGFLVSQYSWSSSKLEKWERDE